MGEVEKSLQVLLISTLMEVSVLAVLCGSFTRRKRIQCAYWIKEYVGLKTGVEKWRVPSACL